MLAEDRAVSFQHLGSKLLAGGLTAGLFLLWWPAHLPTSGLGWLMGRGIVSTLAFEVLLLTFAPLEARLVARVGGVGAVRRLGRRLTSAPARARSGGMIAGACLGVALPAALLFDARPVPPPPPRVVERVVVQKPVIQRKVVVKRVRVAAPTPTAVAAVTQTSAPAAAGRVVIRTPQRSGAATPKRTAPVKKRVPATPTPAPKATTAEPEATPAPAPTPTPAPASQSVARLADGVLAVAHLP